MAVLMRPAVVLPSPPRAVSRVLRKVALLGTHSASLRNCPWTDPSWELWGHASGRGWYRRELDRYFDLHRPECWHRANRKGATYPKWLQTNTVPIFMQEKYPEVPASHRYPKERILLEYGGARRYFKNHLSWMMALAFAEGATTIALFGINYSHGTEYMMQRGSAEYWLGRAEERGITLILPDECSLLSEPAGLYGYESHDADGRLTKVYAERIIKPGDTIVPIIPGQPHPYKRAEPPAHLKAEIEAEEQDRPAWALRALPEDGGDTPTDGSGSIKGDVPNA